MISINTQFDPWERLECRSMIRYHFYSGDTISLTFFSHFIKLWKFKLAINYWIDTVILSIDKCFARINLTDFIHKWCILFECNNEAIFIVIDLEIHAFRVFHFSLPCFTFFNNFIFHTIELHLLFLWSDKTVRVMEIHFLFPAISYRLQKHISHEFDVRLWISHRQVVSQCRHRLMWTLQWRKF